MVNFDIVQGTPYSCESDAGVVTIKKKALDSALNLPNYSHTKLKQLQDDYDNAKKKYDASTCGKDVVRDKCIALQERMGVMRSTIAYFYSVNDNEYAIKRTADLEALKKQFDESKCEAKIGDFRAEVINTIIDVYSEMDKKRIEEQSKYQAKQKIFFGFLVFCGAILIVTMFGKKK
jgi:hypothetical protein